MISRQASYCSSPIGRRDPKGVQTLQWHDVTLGCQDDNLCGCQDDLFLQNGSIHIPFSNHEILKIQTANNDQMCIVLAATKQLSTNGSVRPAVCLSVRLSHLFHYVPIVVSSWNFHDLLPMTGSDVHAKDQDQRSKVKVTEIKTQFSCFQTITPVWIYTWWWNDAHRCRKGALLFFNVIHQISRSHQTNKSPIWTGIEPFRAVTPVWIHQWIWNDAQSLT